MLPGIDVSHYQSEIDWKRVKAFGVKFAFIKATDGVNGVDPNLARNTSGATEAGIPFGLYHFMRPDPTPGNAGKQAEHFLSFENVVAPGLLPPVLDVELFGITNGQVDEWLSLVFGETSQRALIYASSAFLPEQFGAWDGIDQYPLWVAHYTTAPSPGTHPWKTWDFWQHTNSGRVDGIPYPVDLDWFNGSEEDLQALVSA